MRDGEIVAAIVGGHPEGLAEAYDKYAAGLFGYCRTLLHEPADAADAVQDTFVIAASKLGELRDPGRLRPWLYAVARNESHRRLRAGSGAATLDESTDMADDSADVSDAAERTQLRDLVRAAITGLNPGDQEVIELSLRHELEGSDLADALGVPRNHAHALLSRARGQLEKSLAALLVARSGRQNCPALDNLLSGWDGTMTVLMRKRVTRHIDRCEICGERKRRELRPAMLLGVAPLAALPEGLREQVLRLVADRTPEGTATKAGIVQHAGTFGQNGFPAPLDPPKAGVRWRPSHEQALTAGAAAAAAVVIAVVAVLAIGAAQHGKTPTGPAAAQGGGPGPSGQPGGKPGQPGKPGQNPSPGAQPSASASSHATATPGAGAVGAAPQGSGSRTPGGGGSTRGGGGAGGRSGSGGGTPPGGGTGRGTPSTPPPGGSSSPPPPPPPAGPGTVSVSPGALTLIASILRGPATGVFTVTAGHAPVPHFSVSVPSSLLGEVTASPASGSLAAGQSTTVTVTVHGLLSLDTTLTIDPGGHSVTVLLGASIALGPPTPGVSLNLGL